MTTHTTKMVAVAGLLLAALASPLAAQPADEAGAEALATALEIERQLVALVERVRPAYVMIGGGSGVLISPDGYMLTNHHVAGSKADWTVILPDLRRFKAKTIGKDPRGDLCLLKLEKAKDLPYVPLGDSDKLRPGQRVLAIGNPWMAGRMDGQPTVTLGIVSATHVYRGNYTDAIQTDAPINPGNSGGPLITMGGKLIGINGQVAVRFGTDRVNTGIGYAIPSNQIKNFMAAFKKGGTVAHGVLPGVGIDRSYHDGTGARITVVSPNSAAFLAGLRAGDRIVEVEGHRITSTQRLYGVLGIFPAGTEITMRVIGKTGRREVKIALQAREAIRAADPNAPFLGILLAQGGAEGVEVESVVPESGAAKADMRAGDILLAIDGKPLKNSAELLAAIGKRKPGDTVKFKVKRGLDELEISVQLGRRGNR